MTWHEHVLFGAFALIALVLVVRYQGVNWKIIVSIFLLAGLALTGVSLLLVAILIGIGWVFAATSGTRSAASVAKFRTRQAVGIAKFRTRQDSSPARPRSGYTWAKVLGSNEWRRIK